MAYIGSPAAPTIATVSDDTITTAKLADDAVTSAKLDTNIAVDGNLTVDTNTLYVDSTNNNVGIGTPSPDSSNRLQVAGDIGVSWDTNEFIGMKFGSGGSYKMGLMLNDATRECKVWSQSSDSDDKITFYTGPTPSERMRIDSSGKVSLGNTSSDGWLQIKNNNQSDVLITTNDTSGLGGAAMRFKVNNTTVGSISNNTTTTFYNTSSDYRLKENVIEVTDGISRVKLLKPSRFNFIADPDKTVDGFLAHEVANVVPEAITGTKDEVDDDGNPEYQGIDQSKLVPLLTAALQEAITKIETLEARVATLESA